MRYAVPFLLMLLTLSARADDRSVNRLKTLKVEEQADATVVVIDGSAPPTFTVFKLDKPTRLFIDVSNADITSIEGPITVENGVINDITPLQFTDELVQIGRIVVGLETDALYSVKAEGTKLLITVDASQRRAPDVAATPDNSAAIAAAQSRATDAETRAKQAEQRAIEAEQRAQTAEARARSTVETAEKQIATAQAEARTAEANARAAEAKALRAADVARGQADRAASKASDAELKALKLAQEAKAAQEKASQSKVAARQQATAEAAELLARAEAAETMAVASRAEAKAAEQAAAAKANAAQAQTAAADARAEAAENQAQQSKAKADQLAVAAQDAATAAEATQAQLVKAQEALAAAQRRIATAEAKARNAETATVSAQQQSKEMREQLKRARAQVRDLSQSTNDRITQAETRAKAAEARLQAAEGQAQDAIARAEARARQAEVSALKAAESSRVRAQSAEGRAQKAEAEASRLTTVADKANRRASRLRQSSTAVETASRAQAAAEAAQARAEAARQQANAATQAAQAKMAAAEARAQEAIARAQAAEAALKTSKDTSNQRALEAERLAERAAAAEKRAERAQTNFESVRTELDQARIRIQTAEQATTQAREQLTTAQVDLKKAKTSAGKAKARAQVAEMQITVAQRELETAAERARAAEQRATASQTSADTAQRIAATLRGSATTKAERNAAVQAEAEARIAAAEARTRALEAERARLAQELGNLETARAKAKAENTQLASERAQLDRLLAKAKADKDSTQAQLLQAERKAKLAESKANSADIARIESEQASSKLAQNIKSLQGRIAVAERADNSAEAKALKTKLARAEGQVAVLQSQLSDKQTALFDAEQKSRRSRAELEQVRGQMAVAKTPKPIAQQAPVTVETPVAAVLPAPQMRTRITDVQFSNRTEACEIAISFKGDPVYSEKTEGSKTRILEFADALIDPALERSLDTSEFAASIQLVSSFQAPAPGDRVRIVVTLNTDAKAELIRSGRTIRWVFENPVQPLDTIANLPPAPSWNPPAAEIQYDRPKAAVFTGMSQAIETRSLGKPRPARRKRYTGRKINIDIKDGDIHNILRLLAKEGNVNIVTSDEVKGTITMHLKLVPWDQALEIILRTKGLDMVREGDIIRVAPVESIAKERESELKKQEVQEKLKPLEVKLITVNHATASDLMPRIKSVLSKRGSSEFDQRTNTVILKDVDDHLDAAEDLIRRLDTQTPQVLIETRIVEVNEVNVQQLGIQWGIDSTWSAATGNPTGLRFPSSIGISGGADDQQGGTEGVSSNPNFVVNLPASAGLGSGGALGMTFGSIDSTFNLNVRLTALENRGSVKIVSSPKITTLDNKKARISQGVSIPISQISAAGIQTVFFDAVLSLEATPHVTQDGNIYLKLNAQNNTPDFQNVGARGDPTILKKEAQTELLLKDGDTTVIGGIYTSNAGFNRSEVPFLARIPIIGVMFRNHQESDRRSELLIFVTPRIVNRAASTVKTAQ